MWVCIPFPVRHQFINLITVVLLSIKNSISYQIKHKYFRYNIFLSILLYEANDVAIFILSHI